MIQGKWIAPGQPLNEIRSIRSTVFSRPVDSVDPMGWNCLILQNGQPAAVGRIWWSDGSFRLGDIGVLPEFRGQGLGDLALRLLLFKAQSHAAREVRLQSPAETTGFFSRLGFREDSVPEHSELIEMVLPGSEIDLDTCKSCNRQNCPSRRP